MIDAGRGLVILLPLREQLSQGLTLFRRPSALKAKPDLASEVAGYRWFHHIDLGSGVVTPGAGGPNWHHLLQASADIYYGMGIQGQTVLDVGAFDGFNSFAAERAGASRVVAADWWVWRDDWPGGNRIESFRFAKSVLRSNVEEMIIDISDMTAAKLGQFDHVGFNGIVYHIRNPWAAIDNMAEITRRVLTIETAIDNKDASYGVVTYYPTKPSTPPLTPATGWGPNSIMMHQYLKDIGFATVLEFPSPPDPENRSIFVAIKPGHFGEYILNHAALTVPRFP